MFISEQYIVKTFIIAFVLLKCKVELWVLLVAIREGLPAHLSENSSDELML